MAASSRLNRWQRARGPASPNLGQGLRAARLSPQPSTWAPSCRGVLRLGTTALLAGHANGTSRPRAAPSSSLPASQPRRRGGLLLTSAGGSDPPIDVPTELEVSTELAATRPASLYVIIGSPALPRSLRGNAVRDYFCKAVLVSAAEAAD